MKFLTQISEKLQQHKLTEGLASCPRTQGERKLKYRLPTKKCENKGKKIQAERSGSAGRVGKEVPE